MKEVKQIASLLIPKMLLIAVLGMAVSTGYSDDVSYNTSSVSYQASQGLPSTHFSAIHGDDHTIVYEKTETSEEEEENSNHEASIGFCGLYLYTSTTLPDAFGDGEFRPNLAKRYILFKTLKLDC